MSIRRTTTPRSSKQSATSRAAWPKWAPRAALAAILVCGLGAPARADEFDAPNAAVARELFEQGMKLLNAGRFAEACPKLDESARLDPGMGVKYRLAICYENTLRIASAWVLFMQVADEAAAAKMPEREKVARARADALKARVPHMLVVVPDNVASTPGLEVKTDGRPVRAALFGTSLPFDAGSHKVSVSAPGRRTWETTVQTSESKTITVTIPLLQEDVAPGAAWGARHTAGVAIAGLGLVGIAVGAAFGADAAGKHDDSKVACPSRTGCSASAIDLENAAKGSATGSTIGFIAGGAALAGGAVLFLTAGWPVGAGKKEGSETKKAGTTAMVRVNGSPMGGMVTLEGGF